MAFEWNVLESVFDFMVNLVHFILKVVIPHNWIFGEQTRKNLKSCENLIW